MKEAPRLVLEATKETNLDEWYSQVITKSEMLDYYEITGCYILRPWSYSIWSTIQTFLNANFKKLGIEDGYFPIFLSKTKLDLVPCCSFVHQTVMKRENESIEGLSSEVAWVTHSGPSELAQPIAIRPTSEAIMYPAYAKWIQSHHDLPLKLNQWNNVVRWELQQPQPFIRTREFLWQEGHTAFRTEEEANEEVLQILDLYRRVYEELLAIPVVRGRKTEREKFPEGVYTTTVEAFVPANGFGIQGASSHHFGQNYSQMFEITYEDPDTQETKYVYQNSWGLTTRTIGVMVLVHGDNRGLVLPPRVAKIQVIVVPCDVAVFSVVGERTALIDKCKTLVEELRVAGIRADGDYRDHYTSEWKFNYWEFKGVPIRVELSLKDLNLEQLVAVRRLTGDKVTLKRGDAPNQLLALLDAIHDEMLTRATKERDECMAMATSWNQFTEALKRKHMLLAPFCGETACEELIKNDSARTNEDVTTEMKALTVGAKSLCIPFDQPRALTDQDQCIHPACSNEPKFFTLFGRSY